MDHPRSGCTFARYAEDWLTSRLTPAGEPLRPRTVEVYESILRLHILPVFGSDDIGAISPHAIRHWYGNLRRSEYPGLPTAVKCYRLLRAILTTSVEDGLITTNPCRVRGAAVDVVTERAIPTIEEVWRLAGVIERRYRALVLLAGFVGLRRGELLGLQRGDFDRNAASLTIARQRVQMNSGSLVGPPKTRAGLRTLYIPTLVVDEVENHLDAYVGSATDAWMFTSTTGSPVCPRSLQRHWSRARDQLNLGSVRLHDLRHLAATVAAQTGATTKEVMYRLGHTSSVAAMRYQHSTEMRDREMVTVINDLIAH